MNLITVTEDSSNIAMDDETKKNFKRKLIRTKKRI